MRRYTLKNGATYLFKKTPSSSVVIEIMFRVGSNNEKKGIRGISHFLEHMLFEGTSKRPNSRVIASEIENIGGDFNAYTTDDRTAYFVKVLSKHFDKALNVISDMVLNSTFPQKFVEKEKKVILKEIHMVLDDPRFYKWVLFYKTLFTKHPSRYPTHGTMKDVSQMTRKKLVDYYTKYYHPGNMIISIAGNLNNPYSKISSLFGKGRKREASHKMFDEPRQTKPYANFEKRNTHSSYVVMGYRTCPRSHKDSYALDILEAVYGRGQSGRMFEQIRNKAGLSYEVGIQNDFQRDTGVFAVHASTNKEKVPLAKKIMLREFLRPVTKEEVKNAKSYIEGNYTLKNEATQEQADELCYWENAGLQKASENYLLTLKKLPFNTIQNVQKKYFTKNYAVAVVGK